MSYLSQRVRLPKLNQPSPRKQKSSTIDRQRSRFDSARNPPSFTRLECRLQPLGPYFLKARVEIDSLALIKSIKITEEAEFSLTLLSRSTAPGHALREPVLQVRKVLSQDGYLKSKVDRRVIRNQDYTSTSFGLQTGMLSSKELAHKTYLFSGGCFERDAELPQLDLVLTCALGNRVFLLGGCTLGREGPFRREIVNQHGKTVGELVGSASAKLQHIAPPGGLKFKRFLEQKRRQLPPARECGTEQDQWTIVQ